MKKSVWLILFLFILSCSGKKLQLTDVSLGEISPSSLLEKVPLWGKLYEEYRVTKVASFDEEIEFCIIGGVWCRDSDREVPRLLRILKEWGVPENKIKIYLVGKNKKSPIDVIEKYKIHFVPVVIVLKNGKEIKRFVENPNTTWEEDLMIYHQ